MKSPCRQDRIYVHDRYTWLYDLELGTFQDDLAFYTRLLPAPPCTVLELGCGSGRLTRPLALAGYRMTGVDLSPAMLRGAMQRQKESGCPSHFVCMDMGQMAFRAKFDAVIIPYNTLNLLTDRQTLEASIQGVRGLLVNNGRLLMQCYIPQESLRRQAGKKQFQFQIFDAEDKTRVIKEIWKGVCPDRGHITMKEKYYIRPMNPDLNEEWEYHYSLVGLGADQWVNCLENCGFTVLAIYGDYLLQPFDPLVHTVFLVVAEPQKQIFA